MVTVSFIRETCGVRRSKLETKHKRGSIERAHIREDGGRGVVGWTLAGVYLAIEGSDKPRRQCESSIVEAAEQSGLGGASSGRHERRKKREEKRFAGEAVEEYERATSSEGPRKK